MRAAMLRDFKSRKQLNKRFPNWYYIGGDSRKCGGFNAGPLSRQKQETIEDYERRILLMVSSLPHVGCPGNPISDVPNWPVDIVLVCGVNEDRKLIPILEDAYMRLGRHEFDCEPTPIYQPLIQQMRLPIGG